MTNYEIRAKAREDLGGKIFDSKWMYALLAALIYGAIVSVISAVPYIGGIASLLLAGPLVFGITKYFIKLTEQSESPTLNCLFDGFNDFSETFLLNLMMSIFVFLWSLLLVIPGIIKAYAYSMAFYIKNDNPSYNWKQCLDESQKMMDGHKWQLFCLQFSFIGWDLLAALTLGIGYLWLNPYRSMTEACFYRNLCPKKVS